MTPTPLSSSRILTTTLRWSAILAAALAVVGAAVGYVVGGAEGLWSALVAVLLAAVFLGLTAGSILVANRWYGDALYVPIFFGAVMGTWIVKFVVFLVVLLVLRGQDWLNAPVFLVALIVSILASLLVDVVVMTRMRVPHASDVHLPTAADLPDEDAGRPGDRGGLRD